MLCAVTYSYAVGFVAGLLLTAAVGICGFFAAFRSGFLRIFSYRFAVFTRQGRRSTRFQSR